MCMSHLYIPVSNTINTQAPSRLESINYQNVFWRFFLTSRMIVNVSRKRNIFQSPASLSNLLLVSFLWSFSTLLDFGATRLKLLARTELVN
jgi:hypothetical protein